MFTRSLSWLFLGLSVVLLSAAGYLYYLDSDAPGAVIEQTEREFPDLAVGPNTVYFTFRNPTQHPVRIVGAGYC
jgi:hypothetical protein